MKIRLVPIAGIVIFLGLYVFAARLYPGGTRTDPQSPGFSHRYNYWCDLLDATSYSGQPNPGRPLAIGATILLALSLVAFWLRVSNVFQPPGFTRTWVRIAGCGSMLLVPFLYTSAHDYIVTLSGLLGFSAFFGTVYGMLRTGSYGLIGLSLLTLFFCLTNFIMWRSSWSLENLALGQRFAFATFFLWVCAVSLQSGPSLRYRLGR